MPAYLYVLTTQTGTVISKALKVFTRAPHNHASLSFNKELTDMYSFGRIHLYFPFIGGFVRECIHQRVYARFPQTKCALYEIEVSEEQYKKAQKIIQCFLQKQKKYKYSYLNIILKTMNIPYNRRHHFICSQFVAYVLSESQCWQFPKDVSLITPDDFDHIFSSHLIYDGLLEEYH